MFFQGDDNIEQANAFETSADDPRAWTISHPLYDKLIVQPLSLRKEDFEYNVTKFTIPVVETIADEQPQSSDNPADKVAFDQAVTSENLSQAYALNVVPDVADINDMTANNKTVFLEGRKIASDTSDFENYFNLFNTANSKILEATAAPLAAIRAMQSVITAPALFINNVRARITPFRIN